jgi:hypothetical protein
MGSDSDDDGPHDMDDIMPGDVKSAQAKMRILRGLIGILGGVIFSLLLVLVFLVLTADPPAVMTSSPVFDPPPGVYMASGNPSEDWLVDGSHAVRVIARQDANQVPQGWTLRPRPRPLCPRAGVSSLMRPGDARRCSRRASRRSPSTPPRLRCQVCSGDLLFNFSTYYNCRTFEQKRQNFRSKF